jgi:hypothetical protein
MKMATVREFKKQGRCNQSKELRPKKMECYSELDTMVSWFKWQGDSNIQKRKEQLPQRYMLTCHQCEDKPKQKKDDEPPVVDDNSANAVNDPTDATANETVLRSKQRYCCSLASTDCNDGSVR